MEGLRPRGISVSTVTFLVLLVSIVVMTMLAVTPEVEGWPSGRDKKILACRFLKQNGFNLPPECNPKTDWH
ncbi:hypothetical protein ElyMa_001288500 [Elysia marginata]|uniref:Uncharacterized protein n=1 Tax=Elysia marginata TaxID=1093978 RepID=A0AAV4IIQ5_9GAST|nr:hypothetical protein ElyMa_001288500 [Elysia marginata]